MSRETEGARPRLRVAGLVKASRQVEGLLADGDEVGARRVAREIAEQVAALFESHGTQARDLPPPSQKACVYVDGIARGMSSREARLLADASAPPPATPPRSRAGSRREARELGRLLWRRGADAMRDPNLAWQLEARVRRLLDEAAGPVEDDAVADIDGATGDWARWLHFLLQRDHLARAVKALDLAARALREVGGTDGPEIIFVPHGGAAASTDPGPPLAWHVSGVFLNAPKRVWKAVVASFGDEPDEEAGRAVAAYLDSEVCAQVLRKLERRPQRTERRTTAPARGRATDVPALLSRLGARPARPKATWQAGTIRAPVWITADDPAWRLHAVVLVENGSDHVQRGASGRREELVAEDVLEAMVELAEARGRAGGHRPGALVVDDPGLMHRLAPLLEPIGITVSFEPKPVHLARAIDAFIEAEDKKLGYPRIPHPLEPKGMTVAHLRSFAAAARAFYQAEPWLLLTEEDALALEVDADGLNDFRFVRVAGNGSRQRPAGILCTRSAGGAEERFRTLGVTFDAPERTPYFDFDLFEDEQLPVAGREAYPVALRFEGPRRVRRPGPAQLAVLEGILRALAVCRQDEIDGGRFSRRVETAGGPMTLRFTLASPTAKPPAATQRAGLPEPRRLEEGASAPSRTVGPRATSARPR